MDEKKRQQQENKDRKLTARYQVTDSRWTDSKFENDPFGRADAETTDPDLKGQRTTDATTPNTVTNQRVQEQPSCRGDNAVNVL
jgi:hypothetical protein